MMSRPLPPASIAPRAAAIWLVHQVVTGRRLMSDLAEAPALTALDPADRARAQRLALDTLRVLPRADRVLAPHLARRPPAQVMNALRLAVAEVMAGEAAHGVVNDIVAILAADRKLAPFKGLANAVLRKAVATTPAAWAALPVPGLPDWLRAPVKAAWGRAALAGIEAAHLAGAALDITPKWDAAALAARLGGVLLPTGSVRLAGAGQVSTLAGYDDGDWWVQDAAAAIPALVLGAGPGLRVLDLCAAPGGKTMQLAAAGAQVTALDASAARLVRLGHNLARTGLTAQVAQGDALNWAEGSFDAVLLDAPCSATGTIRRHPDLPIARDGAELPRLIATQAAMIDHALTLLNPGGRLVYAVCSLLLAEGEAQARAALARHSGLTADHAAYARPGVDPGWITAEGGLRLRPDHWAEIGGMDGFYIIAFRKPA